MPRHFADTLVERVRALGHPLCAGVDPHLDRIPPLFRRGSMDPADPETASAVSDFLQAWLPRVIGRVAVVKPQSAFFEQLGWRGIRVLSELCEQARREGLLVLLDAKRGDIGSTSAAYAQYLNPKGALPVDAITLNAYLGRDSLEPYLRAAHEHGAGLFVLAKTSNPGSGDYQNRDVEGQPLYAALAESLCQPAEALRGPKTGWSSLDVVVGATYPAEAAAVRERLPHSLFLIPGYGAQGASADDAVASFVPGPAGREGGIVASSRGLLFPDGAATADASAWEKAVDEALERSTSELGQAVAAG
ncbi:MAG: orotidine-5'-phosphate decarboxylase [Proteobacteria bacterium]|nr:orotidine-5'-phosphate decarboxylase [Pseudomonadota bacterium]